jgi:hypothetical protein
MLLDTALSLFGCSDPMISSSKLDHLAHQDSSLTSLVSVGAGA